MAASPFRSPSPAQQQPQELPMESPFAIPTMAVLGRKLSSACTTPAAGKRVPSPANTLTTLEPQSPRSSVDKSSVDHQLSFDMSISSRDRASTRADIEQVVSVAPRNVRNRAREKMSKTVQTQRQLQEDILKLEQHRILHTENIAYFMSLSNLEEDEAKELEEDQENLARVIRLLEECHQQLDTVREEIESLSKVIVPHIAGRVNECEADHLKKSLKCGIDHQWYYALWKEFQQHLDNKPTLHEALMHIEPWLKSAMLKSTVESSRKAAAQPSLSEFLMTLVNDHCQGSAVKAYTGERCPVYSVTSGIMVEINSRLEGRALSQPVKHVLPFYALLHAELSEVPPTEDCITVWRGIRHWFPELGHPPSWKLITEPKSASLSRKVAEDWAGPNGTVMEFKLRAREISGKSMFPSELEALIPMFSLFKYVHHQRRQPGNPDYVYFEEADAATSEKILGQIRVDMEQMESSLEGCDELRS